MAGNGNGRATTLADFIWKNAEDLWGDFKHTDFGKIILPFTLLRRLECVLEPMRAEVRKNYLTHKESGLDLDLILRQITRYPFYNTSEYSLGTLGGTKTRQNLQDYIAQFSDNARVIFEQFDFGNTMVRLDKAGILFKICQNFAGIDLHPNVVPDRVMSNIYEHLIRRFGAEVNEAAEDFMTPHDVVRLATTLLLDPDDALFEAHPGLIRTLSDPACGTGGFLTDAMNHIADFGGRSKIPPLMIPYGQELEPETHAVCVAGMLLRTLESDPGRDLSKNIKLGSTLSNDQFAREQFHYGLANPPFGKKWEKDQKAVEDEQNQKGYSGRFGPGLPRINDGSMLFLLAPCQQIGGSLKRGRPGSHRPFRISPLQRWGGIRRIRDSAVAAGKRSGRSHHCPADGDLLPDRYQNLPLDSFQQETGKPAWQGTVDQRYRPLGLDQERGQQAAHDQR